MSDMTWKQFKEEVDKVVKDDDIIDYIDILSPVKEGTGGEHHYREIHVFYTDNGDKKYIAVNN